METALTVVQGNIVTAEVEAIVNAANEPLRGGGGVDGAIRSAGGPAIAAACAEIRERQGGCPTGSAVITTAGDLNATYVIHTVGPVWRGGDSDEPALLAKCYRSCLTLAVENGIQHIAFPAISTGVYGYPKEDAAPIALTAAKTFVQENPGALASIQFIIYDAANYAAYQGALHILTAE